MDATVVFALAVCTCSGSSAMDRVCAGSPPRSPSVRLAQSNFSMLYGTASNLVAMAPNAVTSVGGSQAHLNMQPFLTLSLCIALQGIFPSPT